MAEYHLNELTSDSMPTEAAVGKLGEGTSIDDVAQSLVQAGIAENRLYFMQGEEAASKIQHAGGFVARLLEKEQRSLPIRELRDGQTLLAVAGVEEDDATAVRAALVDAGLEDLHYFGKWTYS